MDVLTATITLANNRHMALLVKPVKPKMYSSYVYCPTCAGVVAGEPPNRAMPLRWESVRIGDHTLDVVSTAEAMDVSPWCDGCSIIWPEARRQLDRIAPRRA